MNTLVSKAARMPHVMVAPEKLLRTGTRRSLALTGSCGLWGNAEATNHESEPNFRGFGRAKRLTLALMEPSSP
jgi:hypothetical protein